MQRLAVIFITLILFSCGQLPVIDYMSYRTGAFEFTGTVSYGDEEYTLIAGYEPVSGILAVTVSAPAELEGCILSFAKDGTVTLDFGGISLPVSASGGLCALYDMIFPPHDKMRSAEVTELGGQQYNTVVFTAGTGDITVWLTPDSAPVRFDMTYYDGNKTVLNITGWHVSQSK